MKAAALGAIVLGFVLLALSSIWSNLFPATSSWTAEKAAQWSQVQDRLHNLAFIVHSPTRRASMHSGPDPGEAKEEYDRLTLENEQLAAEFQSAYDRPNSISKFLKWAGISLAVVGILAWFATKEA